MHLILANPKLSLWKSARESFCILKSPVLKILSISRKLGEIEATLQTICILHAPEAGGKKLSMRDAKKLTARQLKKIGEALGSLLGSDE